jgi:hypothetical protein
MTRYLTRAEIVTNATGADPTGGLALMVLLRLFILTFTFWLGLVCIASAQDFAANRPATASSFEAAGLEAGKANDGNSKTRWSSHFTDNQWWQVDLGSSRQITRIELNWETAYPSRYRIQLSPDGNAFTTVASPSITSPGAKTHTFTPTRARYVRVLGVTRATGWGFSLFDVRVYGSPADPLPPPPNPQCSDGIDNDADGRTDFPADPGCSGSSDDNEANAPPLDGECPDPTGTGVVRSVPSQYSTIQAAATAVNPGDVVRINAGNYPGQVNIDRGGSPRNYVTFCGVGGRAVIDGTGGLGSPALLTLRGNRSWMRFIHMGVRNSANFGVFPTGAGTDMSFRDFTVNGSKDGGLDLVGASLDHGISNLLIDGCEVQNTNRDSIAAAGHEAISVGHQATNIEVRNCVVHHNGEEGIDVKYTDNAQAKVHDNVVYSNRGPNLYVDSSSNVEVYNNTAYSTTVGPGVMLAVETLSPSDVLNNVKIYNNVVYSNASVGIGFWRESNGTLSNMSITNNTFFGNNGGTVGFITTSGFGGANVFRNNIFDATSYAWGASLPAAWTADHNLSSTTRFVNPGAGDFHLADGHPAIDAGFSVAAPVFDRDWASRSQGAGFDIGAYER